MLPSTSANIACRLDVVAAEMPAAKAVIVAPCHRLPQQRSSLTFQELLDDANRLASGLVAMGVTSGKRIALMVRPGLDFVALTFALFKTGSRIS